MIRDPWKDVEKRYKVGEVAQGTILKVNPFGLFIKLDEDIHGLAHISQLSLAPKERISERFKANQKDLFEIVSMEPKDHRLGLAITEKVEKERKKAQETIKEDKPKKEEEKKVEVSKEAAKKSDEKEDKPKATKPKKKETVTKEKETKTDSAKTKKETKKKDAK